LYTPGVWHLVLDLNVKSKERGRNSIFLDFEAIVPEIEEKNGRYYSVAQVKVIFDKLGVHCKFKD